MDDYLGRTWVADSDAVKANYYNSVLRDGPQNFLQPAAGCIINLGIYKVQINISMQTMKTSIWVISSTSKGKGAEVGGVRMATGRI